MTIIFDGPIKNTTELSNDTGAILETASQQPVTIRREQKKDSIVLLNRRLALEGFSARQFIPQLAAIMRFVINLENPGGANGYPIEFEWLREFSHDEVREFALEFADAIQGVVSSGAPVMAVESVVEQWHKSALLLRDPARRARAEEQLRASERENAEQQLIGAH